MKILGLIPARGGSKGLPGKNIRPLNGKPLIAWSIESSLASQQIDTTIVSTDDKAIADIAVAHGASLPFMRPNHLASDQSTSKDVIIHALEYFREAGQAFDYLVLLQPTSPFRKAGDIDKAIDLAKETGADLVVSVKETASNPYYVLFEEDEKGNLKNSKASTFSRRQDCPKVYELNGSIYVFKVKSILEKDSLKFENTIKFLMDSYHSIDIDNLEDFEYAEFLLQKQQSK
ncbi:acylneuraminate cytidylyltransferase family protein [Putridiphycobacter roseus]|uniref:Acylneuraminate cytidylyltransferase family protein n=1 Tax=Putridiphycobacter roseus TaxID=2219161 RepID=A0A2W1NBL1_9FLAO|nr:acylneuraminate cytidylyltransferase family protein [Putridiphycobacter roseus]PZE16473.1 acylneuraminate cytidylyltransferase family protein [Putridiphycobacter roseus]